MKLHGDLHPAMYEGPPQFDEVWKYLGPLPPISLVVMSMASKRPRQQHGRQLYVSGLPQKFSPRTDSPEMRVERCGGGSSFF